MRHNVINRAKRAFTLIEILIVVVILGILAAIVIPQFTDAADDAQLASVQSQIQTIRGQVELFNRPDGLVSHVRRRRVDGTDDRQLPAG